MLVLASASPRRRELLTQAGYTFQVHPAHIPEDPLPNEDPIAYVTRLARQKAQAVFHERTAQTVREPALKGHDFSRADSEAQEVRALAPEGSSLGASTELGTPGLESETRGGANPLSRSGPALYQGTTSVVPQTPQNEVRPLAPEGSFSYRASIPGAPGLDSETGETMNPKSAKGTGFSPYIEPAQEARALAPEGILTVLGADTTVTLDNHILGKPESPADAARMLRLLSGRTHRVITGIAVVTAARTEVAAEVTAVKFLTLSDEEIAAYIATGEPMDKAGAYAIQGRAARFIPRIEGDYFNVVGLPIALVSTLLESL